MQHYEAIIFDLGNTIFYIDFDLTFQYWAQQTQLSVETIRERFVFDDTHKRFERGFIGESTYARHVAHLLQTDLSQDDFFFGWNSLYQANLPHIEEALKTLKKKYRLVALSNTNITHEKVWRFKYADLFQHFEKVFASHNIGHIKPTPKSYQTVLDYLQIPANQTIFLDDKLENIEGANALGIKGIQVTTAKNMYQELMECGVLKKGFLK